MHGTIIPGCCVYSLHTPQLFISFLCFLIQFKFKILNIEDINVFEKERQRKDLCNILFSMLENCQPEFYYYPIRAL